MGSENPSSADNQQETSNSLLELDPLWVVGFVDGEGCFSVSVHRNSNARSTGGWQLHPVFHVYQHVDHRAVLEALIAVFGCGRLRPKGGGSNVWTYAVDSLRDLEARVIPFFERYPLVVKANDFRAFATIVRWMRQRLHLTTQGFERCVRLAYAMNANGRQRQRAIGEILGSSETARQAPIEGDASLSRVKIQSDPSGDRGSQAEMTWPGYCIQR
jgi:hypothetical protein